MIEIGHFKELNYILNYIYNPMPDYKQTTSESTVQDLNFGFEL